MEHKTIEFWKIYAWYHIIAAIIFVLVYIILIQFLGNLFTGSSLIEEVDWYSVVSGLGLALIFILAALASLKLNKNNVPIFYNILIMPFVIITGLLALWLSYIAPLLMLFGFTLH